MSVHLLIAAVLAAVVAYGLAVAALYLLQDSLIFPRYAVPALTRETLPPGAERLELRAADGGHRLVGTLVRAAEGGGGKGVLLLGFAGNATNAGEFALYLARWLPDLDVAVFHYRGYAPSEGAPGEEALAVDAVTAYDHLAARLRPARVLLAGFSIGSGVAARLLLERRADGLLLVTPFDSLEALAAERYPWMPVRLLLRHRFRSDLHLAGLDVPAAVIAASDDRVVPAARTEALLGVLARPVLAETVPGSTHGGIYGLPAMDAALRRAVDALLAAADAPAGNIPDGASGCGPAGLC